MKCKTLDDFRLISLSEAISMCRAVEESGDAADSRRLLYAQMGSWLEELVERRNEDPAFTLVSLNESAGKCPTMREARKIFIKNGYQMVRQHGSHQIWQKAGDPIPIVLPYHSRDNEQVRPGDWKKIVKEHRLDINA